MYTKDEIISGMCLTFRHDYGLLPDEQRDGIKMQMVQLFEHHFKPVFEDIYDDARCGCPQCMHVVAKNIGAVLGR